MLWLLLFSVRVIVADVPGVCFVNIMVTNQRYVIDRETLIWRNETYTVPVKRAQCCDGYRRVGALPIRCKPVCEPPCINSVCEEPDTCVCLPGHQLINNSNSTCYDVCEACVNSQCLGDTGVECVCEEGYERDDTIPHICNAKCSPPCSNGVCKAPDQCECFQGFTETSDPHVCAPNCTEACLFGSCTAPDTCTCFDGFMNDESNPNFCIPVCDQPCRNGVCVSPNECLCNGGYELHPKNRFHCVRKAPEKYYLKFCEFNLKAAIRFDGNYECFLIKDEIRITRDGKCRPLKFPSPSGCSRSDSCGSEDCVSNFRCNTINLGNGSVEIHCDLETEGFETESAQGVVIDGSEWVDVVLVTNFFVPNNSTTDDADHETRELVLRPLNGGPVCGPMHYGVKICERDGSQLNLFTMTRINIALAVIFFLLVGAGTGGFLWLRYRKQHDPLNYREDNMRGCYQNQSFLDQVGELVPDDESHQEFALL